MHGEPETTQGANRETNLTKSTEIIVKEVQEKDWEDEREHFSSRLYYLLAMVQISLSFNNIFGFPLACMKHGYVAFFIPYTIFTIILGFPLHFMESTLGQYSQLGPVKVWNCAPLARGIGIACICVCVMVAFYNNMYAVYAIMYFSRCFDPLLPWRDCDVQTYKNLTCVPRMAKLNEDYMSPAEHYFYDHILQIDGTEHIGHFHFGAIIWQQAFSLFYTWFIVYLASFQNVMSLQKMLPFFVAVPIFCLLVLASVGIQLHGSFLAFKYFFALENFHHLGKLITWCSAAEQVLVGLGLAQGTVITYGSFAHHRNKTYADSLRVICANFAISIGVSFIICLFLGSLSSELNFMVEFVDFAYVYILFTEVLGAVPGSRIWCMCVFTLIFMSSLNSQMGLVQTLSCVLYDQFPQLLDLRSVLNLAICLIFACSGIVLCTSTSWILLQYFYDIPFMLSRLPLAATTVAIITLVYGINKYSEDMHFLINYYPHFLLRVCFYIAPFLMFGLYVANWNMYSPFARTDYYIFKFLLYFILVWKPIVLIYWIMRSCIFGGWKGCWRSLPEWGPRNEKARVARTYFSSESRATLSSPWNRKRNI